MQLTEREKALVLGFHEIEKFNAIAGREHGYRTVLDKLVLIQEELNETFDALCYNGEQNKNEDIEELELLDGICDILYTVFALPRELEALGYDVFGAFKTVCENNSTKFVKTATEAELSVKLYASKGIECKSVYNEQYDCYAIVDSNSKVRKPINYKSVELDEFLPKEN